MRYVYPRYACVAIANDGSASSVMRRSCASFEFGDAGGGFAVGEYHATRT